MQKFVDFLEKNVQWVALGLGALYLLYMVWGYVIVRPVTIEVAGPGGTQELTPGSIDQFILENRITELDRMMNAPKPVEFDVPRFSDALARSFGGTQAQAFEEPFVFSPPSKIQFQQESTPSDATPGDGTKVAGLPELPAPSITDQGAGRSLVVEIMQQSGGAAASARQPANRSSARNADQDAEGRDQDWVSVFYKIPAEQLADAYKKAGLKEDLYGTTILNVELIRETQQADGSWGQQTVIAEPDFLNVPPLPTTNKAQQLAYADWAVKNVAIVLQPPFYQVTRGDQWPPVQLVDEVVDEQLLKKREADRQRRLDERKRQQDQLKRMQQQRRPTNRRQPGRNTGPGGGLPGGFFAPRDTERPARRTPAAPPMMPPGMMMDPMMGGMPGMMPGMMPGADMPGMMPGMQPGRQLNSKFKAPGLPQGEFDPSQLDQDIQGWAHDVTVKPGAIYRYQVRYKIRNPMFDLRGMVADSKLAEQFAIESPPSGWSTEVEIEPLSYFFVAGGLRPDGQAVRFDVFRSTGGQWMMESFEVSPGDLLGKQIDKVDFATGWTIAALRRDPRTGDTQILLVDDQGNLQLRDFSSDQINPTYKELKQEIAEAAAAETRTRASAR